MAAAERKGQHEKSLVCLKIHGQTGIGSAFEVRRAASFTGEVHNATALAAGRGKRSVREWAQSGVDVLPKMSRGGAHAASPDNDSARAAFLPEAGEGLLESSFLRARR